MDSEGVHLVLPRPEPEGGYVLFRDPVEILSARTVDDVTGVLREAEEAAANGLYAAGFLTYEASPALDPACVAHPPGELPPAWFGLFEREEPAAMPSSRDSATIGPWEPSLAADEYGAAIRRIKQYLEAGDTYQVNYTFRLRAPFAGSPWDLFCRLYRTQRALYCSYVDTGRFVLCSASPELFFALDGDTLTSRPMKGTSPRGLTPEEDNALAAALAESEKNRAENVMIVDMVRNDMGRVARADTVHVPRLFDIERYPTVLQMTSTVTCRTDASFREILRALFPCASITGAPKIRTMQIIHELEADRRGVYTGCIGALAPGRKARFNVAIRTAAIDRETGAAEYGVGGGIVWDSSADDEYEECRIKAAILNVQPVDFQLLETILWEAGSGYFLLEKHLQRLCASAEHFGFEAGLDAMADALDKAAHGFDTGALKVRILLDEDGTVHIDPRPAPDPAGPEPWRVTTADRPVDVTNRFLYHKTTHRDVYDEARRGKEAYDDVILWNERGDVTETTIANIVLEKDGRRLTPPVSAGLLPGVFRAHLIERGDIEEARITLDDLRADGARLFLINSVRRWIPAAVSA